MNIQAMKTCWGAATTKGFNPLGLGKMFWLKRVVYYFFHKD